MTGRAATGAIGQPGFIRAVARLMIRLAIVKRPRDHGPVRLYRPSELVAHDRWSLVPRQTLRSEEQAGAETAL